jgi:hypothetical protein
VGLWQKISSWWDKDSDERLEQAATGSQADRDAAAEDYESLKDDQSIGGSYIAGGITDYERDSEPPHDPAP